MYDLIKKKKKKTYENYGKLMTNGNSRKKKSIACNLLLFVAIMNTFMILSWY